MLHGPHMFVAIGSIELTTILRLVVTLHVYVSPLAIMVVPSDHQSIARPFPSNSSSWSSMVTLFRQTFDFVLHDLSVGYR